MLQRGAIILIAWALVAVNAATAGAIGLCFWTENSDTFVVKSRVPGRNKCSPFNGVEVSAPGAALSGMSCTSADGGELTVHYTSHDFSAAISRSRFESGTCRFPLPFPPGSPQQGNCTGMLIFQEAGASPYLGRFSQLAKLGYCNHDVPR